MDLINLMILLMTLLIEEIENVFIKQSDRKDLQVEHVLYNEGEPSLLQCAQRCRYIDKDSGIDFKDSTCRCVRYKTDDQNSKGTLTKIFINKKIMKLTPPPLKLMNVALHKPANHSSTFSIYSAEKGNDGSVDTRAVTKMFNNNHWDVDLQKVFKIEHMELYGSTITRSNRALIVQTRITDNEDWTKCKDVGNLERSPIKIICDRETSARYVRIITSIKSHLSVIEFLVFSYTNGI